jgi:hypothetical protein
MDDRLLNELVHRGINTFSMQSGLSESDFGWGSPTFHKMVRPGPNLALDFICNPLQPPLWGSLPQRRCSWSPGAREDQPDRHVHQHGHRPAPVRRRHCLVPGPHALHPPLQRGRYPHFQRPPSAMPNARLLNPTATRCVDVVASPLRELRSACTFAEALRCGPAPSLSACDPLTHRRTRWTVRNSRSGPMLRRQQTLVSCSSEPRQMAPESSPKCAADSCSCPPP